LVYLIGSRRRLERNKIAGTEIGDDAAFRRHPAVIGRRAYHATDCGARVDARAQLDFDEGPAPEGPDVRARPRAVTREDGLHCPRSLRERLDAVFGQVALVGCETVEARGDRLREHRLAGAGCAEEQEAAFSLASRLFEVLARLPQRDDAANFLLRLLLATD